MTNGNEPISAAIYRQTGYETSRIATKRDIERGEYLLYTEGLTKREYFSAMAMQGLLAQSNGNSWDYDLSGLSEKCVKISDAIIKALNQEKI